MVSRRKHLIERPPGSSAAADRARRGPGATSVPDAPGIPNLDADDRPLAHRRGGSSGGFGPAIAGIMHGIDADIFRDPASIRRMQRDQAAVAKTADGSVVGIGLPGDGVIRTPDMTGADQPAASSPAPAMRGPSRPRKSRVRRSG